MRNLLQSIIKHHVVLLFIVLEVICIILIVNYNNYPKAAYMNFAERTNGNISLGYNRWQAYLNLQNTNKYLAEENTHLRNLLAEKRLAFSDSLVIHDSINYHYYKAKVVNVSHNKQYNYITINKGLLDGIQPEMAVINHQGVVGIVVKTSDHFSIIMPLINPKCRISARLQVSNYYGSLGWEGRNSRIASLYEIPFHVKITNGEQIVTSGFSEMFPAGIPIGNVDHFELEDGNFHKINVRLSVSFENISYVYVIKQYDYVEKIELERSMEND